MADVIIQKRGKVGQITLNRPSALNALTYEMITSIEKALIEWENDENVAAILVDAKGDRAFCAGGDILDLYKQGQVKNYKFGQKFWADEYRLNARIDSYSKPYVVFMQGFTMGGGVGISCHGSHRIVGETSRIAMPECGIGLVPDVGGSFLLCQKSINLGIYLGTTCSQMDAHDSIFAGFADYFVPEDRWEKAKCQLIETGDPDFFKGLDVSLSESDLSKNLVLIEEVFAESDHESVIEKMSKYAELKSALRRLKKASPLSIFVTTKMLRMPEIASSVKSALEIEYRYTARAQEFSDFQEGIRAVVIDKDKNPNWKHLSLDSVSQEEGLWFLTPLDSKLELRF